MSPSSHNNIALQLGVQGVPPPGAPRAGAAGGRGGTAFVTFILDRL